MKMRRMRLIPFIITGAAAVFAGWLIGATYQSVAVLLIGAVVALGMLAAAMHVMTAAYQHYRSGGSSCPMLGRHASHAAIFCILTIGVAAMLILRHEKELSKSKRYCESVIARLESQPGSPMKPDSAFREDVHIDTRADGTTYCFIPDWPLGIGIDVGWVYDSKHKEWYTD